MTLLSPEAPVPVQVVGQSYPTLRHALLATQLPEHGPLIRQLPLQALSDFAERHAAQLRPLTPEIRAQLLRAKFSHPQAWEALVNSGQDDFEQYGDTHLARIMRHFRAGIHRQLALRDPRSCAHCLFARRATEADFIACIRPGGPLGQSVRTGEAFLRQWPEQSPDSVKPAQLRRQAGLPLVEVRGRCPAQASRRRQLN